MRLRCQAPDIFSKNQRHSTAIRTLIMPRTILPTVNAIIMEFDASNAPLDLMKVGSKLSIERQAMRERGATKGEDFSLWCEMAIFHVYPSFDNGENPWNSFFRPMSSMAYENGITVYSPDITEADADAVDHWSQRAHELRHPVLKARYADCVWEFGQLITKRPKRDLAMAHLAIDAYIETTVKRMAGGSHSAFIDAQRAVDLASNINDQQRVDSARLALLGLHAEIMQEEKGHLWARAFDHLIDHRKARTTPLEVAGLVADLEVVLARVSDGTRPETFDPHATREAGHRLARYYTRESKPDEVKRVRTIVARSFEFVASQSDAMLASSFLQESLDAYKQAGLREEAERIRIDLQEAIRGSKEQMTQHSIPIEIPREEVDRAISTLVVDHPGQTFINIALAFIPKVANMKAQVLQLAKEAPLFAMISQEILAEDHVAAKVGSVEDDESGRLLRQTQQTLQLNLPLLHACIQASIEKHQLKPIDFTRWINREGLFNEGRLELLEEGLKAWFEKDEVKALHVLIPQIENALRRMVDQIGKPTTKPAGTVPGVSVSINMGDILFNVDTVTALGPLGPDFALYMKVIYADPRGMNLRNQFAHGLLDMNEIHAGTVLLLIHTLLVIGAWKKPI